MEKQRQNYLERILSHHEEVKAHPYSIVARLDLGHAYLDLGYADLAAGEFYLVILLLDELTDESGEYHAEAVEGWVAGDRELFENGGLSSRFSYKSPELLGDLVYEPHGLGEMDKAGVNAYTASGNGDNDEDDHEGIYAS